MTTSSVPPQAFYALLIGAACYLPNRLSDGKTFGRLSGSVHDVLLLEEFLKRRLGVPPTNILKLTATHRGDGTIFEHPACWPTYENMVMAFRTLTKMAQPEDQVYIHFSGHGGRTSTLLPDVKAPFGVDEVLVPVDIGLPDARYLRDIELAFLIQEMLRKGLQLTLSLDCCHAGGATRTADASVRGLSTIDRSPRPDTSLVASLEDLRSTWLQCMMGPSATRPMRSGWLPQPHGYVLLAACLAHEKAYEFAFDGKQRSGALTYWLLHTLNQATQERLSYQQLHSILLEKIHGQFPGQTPQLEGDAHRIVFGSRFISGVYTIPVLRRQRAQRRFLLNVGEAHPIAPQATFALFPSYKTFHPENPQEYIKVVLKQRGSTESWAQILHDEQRDFRDGNLSAMVLDPGADYLRSQVAFVRQTETELDHIQSVRGFETVLSQASTGFVRYVHDPALAHIVLRRHAQGAYQFTTASAAPIAHTPLIHLERDDGLQQLLLCLNHLTQYTNLLRHTNLGSDTPLQDHFVIEVVGKQRLYNTADIAAPQLFTVVDRNVRLQPGDWIFLHLRNHFSEVVHVTALALRDDWSIIQLPFYGSDIYFISLDPGEEQILPICIETSTPYTRDITLKVFATLRTTSFRWLELPALPPSSRAKRAIASNLLRMANTLWQAINEYPATPGTNNGLIPSLHPGREWIAKNFSLSIGP